MLIAELDDTAALGEKYNGLGVIADQMIRQWAVSAARNILPHENCLFGISAMRSLSGSKRTWSERPNPVANDPTRTSAPMRSQKSCALASREEARRNVESHWAEGANGCYPRHAEPQPFQVKEDQPDNSQNYPPVAVFLLIFVKLQTAR
jgi:hypothetical protein